MLIRLLLVMAALAMFSAPAQEPDADDKPATKSWIVLSSTGSEKEMVEGDKWEVEVQYGLDPADAPKGATLFVNVLGPWVDIPDGKYTTKRHHVNFPKGGRATYKIDVKPGEGKHFFEMTIPPALPRNNLLLLAEFRRPNGKSFGWHVRGSGPAYDRKGGFFDLGSAIPGNLFTYNEPVKMVATLRSGAESGGAKTMKIRVFDYTKTQVAEKEIPFTAEKAGQKVPIDLELTQRGTFLIEAEVAGWEKQATTFCRIPDVLAITKGGRTAFGMHNTLGRTSARLTEGVCKVAQKLGLTASRNFVSWYDLEPSRGNYRFEVLDKQLDISRQHGIDAFICIVNPPVWALKGGARNVHYQSFDGDWDAFGKFVTAGSKHYKGRLYAWEWLNEIVPAGPKPVEDYLHLLKVGTEAARAEDPNLRFLLAGGLFPRSFRKEVLAAGAAKYIDTLPIHYGNGAGVQEARMDLDGAGAKQVAVWDDETGRGISTWGAPPIDDIAHTVQAEWILGNWPDQLAAGAERIIYFGGSGDAAGNWDYIFDDLSPRPACATLAVLASKLHGAKPQGSFGEGGLNFWLFERDGKSVAYVAAVRKDGEAAISVGTNALRLTDYQGTERELASADGKAALKLGSLGAFIEGGDLDTLRAYAVPAIKTSRTQTVDLRARSVDGMRVSILKGSTGNVFAELRNVFAGELSGSVELKLPTGWTAQPAQPFKLAAGESATLMLPIAVPATAKEKEAGIQITITYANAKLPVISRPVIVAVLSPDSLGNLLDNGGFEKTAKNKPEGWNTSGMIVPSEGLGEGLGKSVVKLSGPADKYQHLSQSIDVNGNDTYLYTAWVWNDGISCGSNIGQTMKDGTNKTLTDVRVFRCGDTNSYWQMFTCRFKTPAEIVKASFTPVAKGKGNAYIDNLRVTVFEGTDFAAEAHRTKAAPAIDGDLADWNTSCPIPLIGKNQLSVVDPAYAWTPQSLNGVAYLAWDDNNLYVALNVRDDVNNPAGSDGAVTTGDGFTLAFDPGNRGPDADKTAFELDISAQKPGGGSGKYTIFRPAAKSGGMQSGHLMRDSSVYELAIKPVKGGVVYELRIPFTEIGGFQSGIGRKLGASIRLNDNDGKGLGGFMTWGGGLGAEWRPADLGVITLVE